MARSGFFWLVGALLMLSLATWYILQPARSAVVQEAQRAPSPLEVTVGQEPTPVSDSQVEDRAFPDVELGRTSPGSLAE